MERRKLFAGLLAFTLVLALAGGAFANNLTFFQTQFGVDWTQTGICGLRGLGTGTITLAGVSGSVTKAYLYWHGPTNLTNPAANANITLNGTQIVGTNIGFSDDNFWGFANSQAYRADVTSLVPGNGAYTVANMIKSGVEINGASLIVFFNDGNTANDRDVVMFDGNDANFINPYDALGWSASLSGINYVSGTAAFVLGVSDGQDFSGLDDPGIILNGTTLIPIGDNWNGNTLPNAGGGVSNGGLWDITTYDVTPWLSPGPNTLNLVSTSSPNDALSLIHLGIDLPAGAAPPDGDVPEPATIGLLGLAGLGLLVRRRKRR